MAKILVVEDEVISARSIRAFLETSNHQVLDIVDSGSNAIEKAAEFLPDLVLIAIYLRDQINGITVADRIYQHLGVPIIYLSGTTEAKMLQQAITTKPFGYLAKPFTQTELVTIVNIALQRHQLEKQLEQTEQWLKTTLSNIGDGAIATDSNGFIMFMNPVAEAMTGWQQAEALGKPSRCVLDLVDAKTHEAIADPLVQAMQEKTRVTLPETCILRTKDGSERAIADSATPIQNRNGEILGGVLVFQDITDRKRSQDLLHQREQEFRALIENSPDTIARFDRDLRYLYVNPAIERLTGIPVAEFIGKTACEMNLSDSFVNPPDQHLRQVFATAQEQTIASELTTPTGICYVQSRIVPEFAPDGQVLTVLSVTRDITDRTRIAEALRLQTEREAALYQQTQALASRERSLNRVIKAVRQSLNLTTIFDTAVAEIGNLLQVDQVAILQYLPEQHFWVYRAIYHRNPDQAVAYLGLELPDEGNPQTAILKQGRILQIDDTSLFEDEFSQILAQTFPGAWLKVPLQLGAEIWGAVSLVHHEQPFVWQDWQVDLTRTIADQLAIAIHQAELYTEVQRLNSNLEAQVLERTAQVQQALSFEALLKRITDKVRDSLDENQILETAVAELGQGLQVKFCGAAIYSADLTTAAITHQFSTLAETVVSSREFLIADEPACAVYYQLFRAQHCQFCWIVPPVLYPSEANHTILACPILDDQGVLGDLWLFRPAMKTFNEIEIRLVEQVANQCAIAIRQSRLYQASQAQIIELERLNQLKDDFLSTISHELRTPMANIKMAIQLLETVLRPSNVLNESTPASRYFQILAQECDREIALISNLLKLSRLDTEAEPLTLATIHPEIWINHAIEPFLERIRTHHQSLTLNFPDSLPPLTTDLSCLEQILHELLTNAIKYSPAESNIIVTAHAHPTRLQLDLTNTGIEIPPEEIPRIFEKFYRIPNSDPWKYQGTGIGLALVKKLVAHIGATIAVQSGNGQTTFSLQFLLNPKSS